MTRKEATRETDPEIVAIGRVYAALKGLAPEAQTRVLEYVAAKLKIEMSTPENAERMRPPEYVRALEANDRKADVENQGQDEVESISPVARKWMARNGLGAAQLSQVFSLSGDEIDLIANTVPGKSKRERMRSVFLLKGVAAYLGSGAARFTHQQIKEACLHYDAFDAANFSHHFKSLSAEVSGSKDAGYSLTPRGLANATEMMKTLTLQAPT